MVDHGVVVLALPTPGLTNTLRLGVSAKVHMGEVHPNEGRFASLVLPLDELHCPRSDVIVNGFHPLFGQWTRVLAHLLANLAEAWINGRIILVRGLAVQHATRAELGEKRRVLWIVGQFRLFASVEVVQGSVELVEAMHSGQVFVTITQMIFAELAGCIASRPQ